MSPNTLPVTAPVLRMLDLSTAHLPQDLGDTRFGGGLPGADGVTAYAMGHGFLMWVPDEPAEYAEAQIDGVPAEVLAVQLYARAEGCEYVRFDADAGRVDELETWTWES